MEEKFSAIQRFKQSKVKKWEVSMWQLRERIRFEKWLKRHRRIHTGQGLFTCKYSNRRFTQSCHLLDHVKTHTGEKPFSCDYSKRSFMQKPNLIRHLRVHTGEKPFSCNHCLQKFRFKRSLKYHIIKHHNSNE
ncbi:protein krueppel-like [Centruroides sculpturatus]|uniref:protein krueppel-like n=1 Tax=Centruroides sculpturatus TaxID=218467 RepID=UPI000C6D3674|nr:protein krueppel-like [Centruroides sculpturatus]